MITACADVKNIDQIELYLGLNYQSYARLSQEFG